MQSKIFTFLQRHKDINWTGTREQLTAFLNTIFRESSFGNLREDFEIEIRKLCKKRSGQQLRTYWRLIRVLKDWMNEQGNRFTDEQVSDWVKIQAGHYQNLYNLHVAKSIANNSDATVEDMKNIIEFILDFGKEYAIRDCIISVSEYEELINFYSR